VRGLERRGGGARAPNDDLASTHDSTCGFHLLISMCFMVREKTEREKMPASSGTAVAVDAGSVVSEWVPSLQVCALRQEVIMVLIGLCSAVDKW